MDIFEAEMVRRFVVAVEKIANALDRKDEPQTVDLGNGFSITANGTKTPNYCGTCKYREVPCGDLPCDVCHGYSNYEPKDESQADYDKGLKLFADILFDKEKSGHFLKECKAIGIDPQTERSK